MNHLIIVWGNVRASFWFVPSLIVAGSIVLAIGMIETTSAQLNEALTRWPRLFGAGAEGARSMLSTIAGSMMSVVGVTFSMTLVALALASSQYSSRILRNFLRNRRTQIALGIFVGIFTYCLIVLRTIRGGDEGAFIPSVAVFVAVLLAVAGVGVLIFFIHHIAQSIQASSILAEGARETLASIDRLFPESLGNAPEREDETPLALPGKWHVVTAVTCGYIQGVDEDELLRLARTNETVIRMDRGIGDFTIEDTPLASFACAPDASIARELRECYDISRFRNLDQDPAFGVRQIVDVALKALSPGINDTTTAVMCIDYLTAILARLASRRVSSAFRFEEGELRVIAKGPSFSGLLGEAFDQIRRSAEGNVTVMLHILDALHTLAGMTTSAHRRRALATQAQWIGDLATRTVTPASDKAAISNRLEWVRSALETIQAP